jgi:hypothetical protein
MKKLLILLMLIPLVNAYSITWEVRDLNTKNVIDGATINFINDSDSFEVNTSNGLATGNIINYTGFVRYNISKIGYFPTLNAVVAGEIDTYINVYMTPISNDGIVRVLWSDDTLNYPDRKLCFFFKENDRLDGCYYKNETIQLINNKEYYVEPQTNFYDQLFSIDGLWSNKMQIMPYVGLILLILYIVMVVIRKK